MARSNLKGATLKKSLFLGVACIIIAAAVILASNWHAVAALYHPTPTPKPVQLTYTNREHGLSLKFPQYWSDSEPTGYIATFDAPEVEGCDMALGVTILYVDLPAEKANETLEEFVVKSEEGIKGLAPNYKRLKFEDTTISGLPAKLLQWNMSNEMKSITTDQAVVRWNNKIYVLTYSAQEEFHDIYIDGFDLIVSTLKFKQPSVATNTPLATP